MTTYTYACATCATRFDVEQSIRDNTLTATMCPSCGVERDVTKIFSAVGIAFKGSGFYKTDSQSSTSKARRAENSDKSSTESKGDTSASSSDTPSKSADTSSKSSDTASSSSSSDSGSGSSSGDKSSSTSTPGPSTQSSKSSSSPAKSA